MKGGAGPPLNIDALRSFHSGCERELVMGLKAKERLATLTFSGLDAPKLRETGPDHPVLVQ
jgi:hypothetical protein